MKNYFILSVFFLVTVFTPDSIFGQYITVWKTDNPGVSNSNQVRLPVTGGFNYTWTEVSDPGNTGSGSGNGTTTITFPHAGTYELSMVPTGSSPFSSIGFDPDSDNDTEKLIELKQWGNVAWSSFHNAYAGTVNLTVSATDIPNLNNVTDMAHAFQNSAIHAVSGLNNWDMGNVTDMSYMFMGTHNFNQPINNWDVSQVTDMSNMFDSALSFNQPLNNWDVGNVTDMHSMFRGAYHFNQPLDNWDVSNVTNMQDMFRICEIFNQSINSWDVSHVTNMQAMFFDAVNFNQPLDNWNVGSVTNMSGMFSYDHFNQPLNNWDVSHVINMSNMFDNNDSFNRPLSNWDLTSLQDAQSMFRDSAMNCINYSLTLHGWANNPNTASDVNMADNNGMEYSPDVAGDHDYLANALGWNISGDSLGNCMLGAEDHDSAIVAIYPNPANGSITISGLPGTESITLYDINGKQLQSVKANADKVSLNLAGLADGVYLVTITLEDGNKITKKILKK